MYARLHSIYRSFIRFRKTTDGGERDLPNGQTCPRQNPIFKAIINPVYPLNSDFTTCVPRKFENNKPNWRVNMACTGFAITITGSEVNGFWSFPSTKSSAAADPISLSASVGRMKTGHADGMAPSMRS